MRSQTASSANNLENKPNTHPGAGARRAKKPDRSAPAQKSWESNEGHEPTLHFPAVAEAADRRHPMTVRTIRSTVSFGSPFTLDDPSEILPAGDYDVEIDEELLEGLSFLAYRKIMAVIHLPMRPGQAGIMQTLSINPQVLDAALKRDKAAITTSSKRLALQQP